MCMWSGAGVMLVRAGAVSQKRMLDLLELQLQMNVSHLIGC